MRSWTHRWTWGVCQHQPGAAAGGGGQTGKNSAAAWRGAAQRPGSPPTAGGVHQRAVGYWSSAVTVGKRVSDESGEDNAHFCFLTVRRVFWKSTRFTLASEKFLYSQHNSNILNTNSKGQSWGRCINTGLIQEIWLQNTTSYPKTVLVNEQEVPGKTITMETVLNMRMNNSPFGRVQSLEGGAGRSPAPAASAIWRTGRGVSSDDALGLRPGGRWLHWQWCHQQMSKPTHTGKLEARPPVNQKSHWCFSLQMNQSY